MSTFSLPLLPFHSPFLVAEMCEKRVLREKTACKIEWPPDGQAEAPSETFRRCFVPVKKGDLSVVLCSPSAGNCRFLCWAFALSLGTVRVIKMSHVRTRSSSHGQKSDKRGVASKLGNRIKEICR